MIRTDTARTGAPTIRPPRSPRRPPPPPRPRSRPTERTAEWGRARRAAPAALTAPGATAASPIRVGPGRGGLSRPRNRTYDRGPSGGVPGAVDGRPQAQPTGTECAQPAAAL